MRDSRSGPRLFQLIPAREFNRLCDEWNVNKHVRKLTAQKHVWSLILAYLCKLESLREIEMSLGIPKSTLSDANGSRSAKFFEELCRLILWKILQKTRGRKVRQSIRTILAMDSTECQAHGAMARLPQWKAKHYKGNRAGVKLHVIWNLDGEWIEEFRISPVRVHDAIAAKAFKIRSRCTYVFDRAYNEVSFWWKIMRKDSHFVTRLKLMPKYAFHTRTILSAKRNQNRNGVLWQGTWRPTRTTFYQSPEVPKTLRLRHVIYRDALTKKVFNFISSDFDSPAQELANIYKKRWAVELLFRWLKGHLKIRLLQPRNRNAIQIQLLVSVLVQLLVQLYRLMCRARGSLWDCLRFLRVSLIRAGTNDPQYELFYERPRLSAATAGSEAS